MSANRSFTRRQFKQGGAPPEMMQLVAKAVTMALPKGWAFACFAFPLDSRDGGLRYVSNGDRESVLKLMREFVQKQDAAPPPPSPEAN
jgi:hypothetical protein